ncbi:ABC transporter substrate-binding protein [Blastococcus sp. TML/C7B]|nr:ABC transporter substrate-binding protein [Blastococcus sp. TML/C7B]
MRYAPPVGEIHMRGHRRPQDGPWTRVVVSAGLAALLLGSAACGGGDDDGGGDGGGEREVGAVTDVSEQGDPVDGGEIVVGLEAETSSWLPGQGTFNQPGVNVAYSIYDPLMHRTAEGEVEPYLAESMEPNAELTEWTLTLRPGVRFHDGTPLDAQALKTIFDDYLTAPGANTAASLDEVTALDVVDQLTVVYRLREANAAFPVLLISSPGWPFSPTAAAAAGEDAGARPVGTGPFRFVSWQRDSQLVVSRSGPCPTRTPGWPACAAVTSTRCSRCGRAPSSAPATWTASTATSTSAAIPARGRSTPASRRSTTSASAGRWPTRWTRRRSSRCWAVPASPRRRRSSSARTAPTTPRRSPRHTRPTTRRRRRSSTTST